MSSVTDSSTRRTSLVCANEGIDADPRPAIIQLHNELKALGITLVVLPVAREGGCSSRRVIPKVKL